MIFVTIGTTLPFDSLLQEVDGLVVAGKIEDDVVCQIGNSAFTPTACSYFRFAPRIDDHIAKATLVITHGGTGTVLPLALSRKAFIAVANPLAQADHQAQFLAKLESCCGLLWTTRVAQLHELIRRATAARPGTVPRGGLAEDIRNYLGDST